MDRSLLTKIMQQMRDALKKGKPIGDLKTGALYALGQQLEAIYYFIGHELGSILKVKRIKHEDEIGGALKKVIEEYNIGDVEITQSSDEIIQLQLKNHSSIKDLIGKGIKTKGSFCSFEAGLLAGIVENMSDTHCFAQELNCSLQTGEGYCEFMIVFQKD
jgi:predicted hydrocarbon binding protein